MSANGNKIDENGNVNHHHQNNNYNNDGYDLEKPSRVAIFRAPQPTVSTGQQKVGLAARLGLVPRTEAPHRSDRSVDHKVDPAIKRLELAPSTLAHDPPTLTGRDRPAQLTQQTQLQQGRVFGFSRSQQHVGAVHVSGPSGQRLSREHNDNHSSRVEALAIAAVVVEDDDRPQAAIILKGHPYGKPQRSWLYIGLCVAIVVVSLSIAIPVTFLLQGGSDGNEPVVPFVPTFTTMAPSTAAPSSSSKAPVTSAPSTAAPSSSSERLATLIRSRLPSVSFDNTTSSESRALVWLARVDTSDQQTLSDDQLVQRFALAAIGLSINGLDNWLVGGSECSWGSGQVVCNSSGEVIRIDAVGAALSGSIPVSIGLLTKIGILDVHGNQLIGTIPTEVGGLTALTVLYLHRNSMTGTIPTEVGDLTALFWLGLHENQLTGTIPTEIGGLTALTWFGLSVNTLTGSIPVEFDGLQQLKQLFIHTNRLNGTIPSEMGSLTALEHLYLYNNALSGAIPTELGSLPTMNDLYLYNNTLTGTMPDDICGRGSPRIDCDEVVCECCRDASGQQCS